jgi:Mechanosensitive ion channel, beta-domain
MKTEQIILYVIISLVVLAGFRILSLLSKYMLNKNRKIFVGKYLPAVESIFWMVYLVLSINIFINRGGGINSVWILCVLIILILLFSWYAFRDIISGVIWKTNKRFKVNDSIKVGEFQGKIKEFHHRNLEIITENEESILIPYTKILQTVIIKSNPTEMILSYSFRIHTNKEKPSNEIIQEIRFEILNLPWSSAKTEPKIKPLMEDKTSYAFDVTIYSMDKDYFYKIENIIKGKFEEK